MLKLNKIYCGDCLEVMKEIEDKSVDLVLTDPPYGIGEARGKNNNRGSLPLSRKWLGTKNTTGAGVPSTKFPVLEWDNQPPTKEYFTEMFRISKSQIIFGGNYFELPPTPCYIVWDKDNGDTDFADCELAWTSFKTAVRKYTYQWNGMLQGDMAHKEKRFHPTQKPVALFRWILEKYTEPNMTILDPFAGSCTTAIACIKTGRNFICIDKEPQYCEIGERRIAALPNTKLDRWFQ